MKDVQELYALASIIPAHLKAGDRAKPHFTVAVRTNGPWVGMVVTNHFRALMNGVELVSGLLDGSGDYHLLVERQVQDTQDDTVSHSTVLMEERGG